MATYANIFDFLGLRDWCDESKTKSLLSLRQLKGDDLALVGSALPVAG